MACNRTLRLLLVALLVPAGACDDEDGSTGSPSEQADATGEDSADAASNDLGGDNRAPSQPGVSVTPERPLDADALICAVSEPSEDPDGDTVAYRFAWTVDGEPSDQTASILPSRLTFPGQTWECLVTPSDGDLDGPVGSASVFVYSEDDGPSQPGVAISPQWPLVGDDLTCVIERESFHPTGAQVTYTFEWLENFAVVEMGGAATVPGDMVHLGEFWTCNATPSDGEHEGTPGSAEVFVGGSQDGIYITLSWANEADEDPTDTGAGRGSDLDLHFMHPNGSWDESPWDCHWKNQNPSWGLTSGIGDDPQLVREDTDGWGPEVTVLPGPEGTEGSPASYSVGVYYFSDHGFGEAVATVRVFSDGELAGEWSKPLTDRQFWDIARISWPSGAIDDVDHVYPNGFP